MAGNSPPPGWYADGQGRQRWWDGTAWFESVEAGVADGSEDTRVLDERDDPQPSQIETSLRPTATRGFDGRKAGLTSKGPLVLMIVGGLVAAVAVIAMVIVDPTCLNNEDCGVLSETYWSLFGRGIVLLAIAAVISGAGFFWSRRRRSVSTPATGSIQPAARRATSLRGHWYRRRSGIALIAISVLVVAGVAVGLALSADGGDESGLTSAEAQDPSEMEEPDPEEAAAAEEERLAAEAEAEKQTEAEEKAKRDPKTYNAISHRKWAQVAKDPDSYVGKKYVLYGWVTQFDSATGNDSFLVSTDAVQRASYEYDINTIATTDEPERFRKVVEDDLVKMYVEVGGSISYDTQIGGNTTVPSVLVNIIKVTGSAS